MIMKTLRNEKGFALGFVLILSVIGLLMTLAMMIMVSRGGYVSGQQRMFRSAVEAGMGGVESMFHILDLRGNTAAITLSTIDVQNSVAFGNKINRATSAWAGLDNVLTINPSNASSYDVRVDLGMYRVFIKVADTVEGNSAADEGLIKSGVVNSGAGEITVPSVPYLYTIEVLSQNRINVNERSRISVLYQY
ncbi:MAG: hypothetical protein FWH25_02825 [Syntrophorhabdaceae bacterium]|nr:hypothetical protein [Syntrophorhabdaceae bacterium]